MIFQSISQQMKTYMSDRQDLQLISFKNISKTYLYNNENGNIIQIINK